MKCGILHCISELRNWLSKQIRAFQISNSIWLAEKSGDLSVRYNTRLVEKQILQELFIPQEV